MISSTYKIPADASITAPYGHMSMEIAQAVDSHQVITEINPLEVAEIFGNIGGFWDLLLLLWPVLFVAVSPSEPSLRLRKFKMNPVRNSTEKKEQRPDWDVNGGEQHVDQRPSGLRRRISSTLVGNTVHERDGPAREHEKVSCMLSATPVQEGEGSVLEHQQHRVDVESI